MKTICKETKKILCCFIVMCAAFAASGILGATSTYAYDEQAVLGVTKTTSITKLYYEIKYVAEKTGVYEFTQSNQTSKNNIIVFDSEINELGHVSSPDRGNSIKFYALKDKTYYIYLEKDSDVTEYSATYCLNFEKEMEYVPSISCIVTDGESEKDLLKEGKNFSFDAETRTLEIKDYSGKMPYIKIVDEDGSIAWDPDDVYSDDPFIKIKILGKNTIDLGYTDFVISLKFGVRYIGDGVLNLQNISDRSNIMYSKGMVIDGPTINVVDTCSIEKRNDPAVYVSGDFEMISGELNINTKGYALRITEDAYLKGGKININISEATDRCAFDVYGEMNFAGTDVNIDVKDVKDIVVEHINYPLTIIGVGNKTNFSGGSLYVKDDNYAAVLYTREFNMIGGSIYADLAEDNFDYGYVIKCSGNVNVDGGDFVVKFNDRDYRKNLTYDPYNNMLSFALVCVSSYDNEINVDNTQIVLLAENEKLQDLLVKNNKNRIDNVFIAFDTLSTERFQINAGKNVKIIIGKDIDINELGIKLLEDSFIYDGNEKKPALNLRGLRDGIDVDITYSDNVNVGKGKVTLKGKGDFTGTLEFNFTIKDKNGNIPKKDNASVSADTDAKLTFDDGKYIYKITKAAGKKAGKVEVIGLKKKSLKKINIKATVKHDGAKYNVTSIAANAFKNNNKIKTVKIGKNVVKIGKKAFYKCKKLTKVVIKSAKIKTVGKKAFTKTSKKLVIKTPKKKKNAYSEKFKKAGFKGKIK